MYYLYSVKYGGWVSTAANYVSDITEAQEFSHDEAMTRAKAGKTEFGMATIPVAVSLVEELS